MDQNQFAVYEHVSVPVFVVAPDDNLTPHYLWVNDAWSRATGIAADTAIGRTETQLFPDRTDQRALDHHRAALTTGRGSRFDLPAPWPGTGGVVRTTLQAVSDTDGRITHAVGTCETIPAADSGPVSDAEALSEAEHFIAIAAHDLRTPLRNIRTLIALLKDDLSELDDGKGGLIDVLDEVAAGSGQMISDILAYTEALASPRETETTDLRAYMTGLRETLDPQHMVQFDCPDLSVICDAPALRITLRNLVDNVIKHNLRKNLSVALQVSGSGTSDIRVSVVDNGKGFTAPERLFLQTTGIANESGYGLMAVQRLLHLRGGRITAANAPGGTGGVVTFWLPGQIADQPPLLQDPEPVLRLPRTATR